jgi:hypothetical protein
VNLSLHLQKKKRKTCHSSSQNKFYPSSFQCSMALTRGSVHTRHEMGGRDHRFFFFFFDANERRFIAKGNKPTLTRASSRAHRFGPPEGRQSNTFHETSCVVVWPDKQWPLPSATCSVADFPCPAPDLRQGALCPLSIFSLFPSFHTLAHSLALATWSLALAIRPLLMANVELKLYSMTRLSHSWSLWVLDKSFTQEVHGKAGI